mgnify:FL=1
MSLFSENLQELMSERNLTQTSLAEAMGTCSSKLSSYITGNRAPNYDTLIQLVEFFHCSADFLLGIKEYPCEDIDYLPVPPFSQRLRTVLKEMNCTQYSFIKQTKISWGVFYNWLSGKSNPSVDNLVKIASFFDCSVDFVLGRVK